MKGKIHSDQKCAVCGGKFKHFENEGIWCPKHPDQRPTRLIVRFGRKITRRFRSYGDAERFLTGVRYETDQGKFDIRDYQNSYPLGFAN